MKEDRLEKYLYQEDGLHTAHTHYGFYSFEIYPEEKTLMCAHFAVDDKYQKQGYGQRLGKHMEATAKEFGLTHMACNVFRNKYNKNSFIRKLKCFEDFGFVVTDMTTNCITMVKEI